MYSLVYGLSLPPSPSSTPTHTPLVYCLFTPYPREAGFRNVRIFKRLSCHCHSPILLKHGCKRIHVDAHCTFCTAVRGKTSCQFIYRYWGGRYNRNKKRIWICLNLMRQQVSLWKSSIFEVWIYNITCYNLLKSPSAPLLESATKLAHLLKLSHFLKFYL